MSSLGWASVGALLVAVTVGGAAVLDRLGGTASGPSLHLDGTRRLTIDRAEPAPSFHAELEAQKDGFTFDVTCGGMRAAPRHGELARAKVQAFLAAVEARSPTADPEAYCADADDRPTSTVLVVTPKTRVELTTRACSRQWSANGHPLAEDPQIVDSFGGNAGPHAAINASYAALLDAMDATDCQVGANSIP